MRIAAGILLIASIFGVMFGAGPELVLWFKSRSWQPAEATILQVVPAAKSQQGVTEIHYRYEARGGLHEGSRAYLSPRWMPGGEVLAEWEKRFMQAQQQARPVRLWVSPQNAEDAVIVRDLNWPAMAPLLAGAGIALLTGLTGLFWPQRLPSAGQSESSAEKTATKAAKNSVAAGNTATPSIKATISASSADDQQPSPVQLSLQRMERRWTVELKAQPGAVDVVESVTLDRLDAQGIMRWQDNLPLQVLDNKRCWHVQSVLPTRGLGVEQARTHPQDRWQVTFKLRDASGARRLSQSLPQDWPQST